MQLGREADADELSARTIAGFAGSRAAAPNQVWDAMIARGHVLASHTGRDDLCTARFMLETAWDKMYKSMPAAHPPRQMLLQDLARVCAAQGDAPWADIWQRWLCEEYSLDIAPFPSR